MIKSPEILNNLTPVQIKYYNDEHRFIIVTAGRRSRKTLIGQRKVLLKALTNEDRRYFLGAPTRAQAKEIFWRRLVKDSEPFRKDISKGDLSVTFLNGSEIIVVGLDRPERVEGQVWQGCHITEIANIKSEAWAENIRPALADTGGFAILDGVPEGRNHYYDMALFACDDVIPKTVPLHGAYHDCKRSKEWVFYSWFSADVLPAAEVESYRQERDARTFRQEYEGSFESYAGIAYYTFGKHNFYDVVRDYRSPISVGMDFNVNPMTAVLGTIKGDSYHQWGEIWLENSNTYEMAEELKTYTDDPSEIIIYPDSTGKAEKSNATESDLAILRKAGFEIRAHRQNPFIIDRVNACNSIIMDRGAKTRYLINPKECPKTINDWNRVIRTDDGRLDKNQEKEMIGHISAGAGYLFSYNWPVKESHIDYTERY